MRPDQALVFNKYMVAICFFAVAAVLALRQRSGLPLLSLSPANPDEPPGANVDNGGYSALAKPVPVGSGIGGGSAKQEDAAPPKPSDGMNLAQGVRQIVDALADVSWIFDARGQLEYANKQWYEFLGAGSKESLSATFSDALHPDDRVAVVGVWADALATGRPWDAQFRFRRADGAFRRCRCRVAPIHALDGGIVGWFGAATDLEAQKQSEYPAGPVLSTEQWALTKSEEDDRLKDEFLSILSHELRTPVNAIMGWANLLKNSGPASAEQDEALRVIERNAGLQTKIIEDLLDISRLMNGKIRLAMRDIDPAGPVKAAIDAIRPAAAAKDIRLREELHGSAGVVRGDAVRLQQVVGNLLSNAVKFTPGHGEIIISTMQAGPWIKITVRDNGQGISPEFLPHLFDRFRQQDPSTTRQHGGLGLGLAIVNQLVGMHGGNVAAASDGPGRGAAVTVALPVAMPTTGAKAAPDVDLDGTALRGARIMVVDDHPDARTFMKRLLGAYGATVFTAGSAPEAMDLLTHEPMDILVSDISMPGEDGYSLIRHVRALPTPANRIAAIAVTAYAQDKDRAKALDSGFQMHLPKPIEPADLLAIIASLMPRGSTRAG